MITLERVNHILKTVPFYKKKYPNTTLHSLEGLWALPPVTKQDLIQGFPADWMTEEMQEIVNRQDFELMTTSGSSGERMQIIRPKGWWDKQENHFNETLQTLFPTYKKNDPKAILTTAICSNTTCFKDSPPMEKRIANGILQLNTTENPNFWTREDVLRIREEIEQFKPICMQVSAIYLALFLKQLQHYQIPLPSWKPALLVINYQLTPQNILHYLQETWKIPYSILYGSTENGHIYYQDQDHLYRSINKELLLYHAPLGDNLYKLRVLSLKNSYMPLINYDTNDIIEAEDTLTSGHFRFMGREKEKLISSNQKMLFPGDLDECISSLNLPLFLYTLEVYSKEMVFKYMHKEESTLTKAQEKILKEALQNLYGSSYKIALEMHKTIDPLPSGKFALVQIHS